jgi:crossover junction endodeoxyribonuclease RuvC
MDLLGIDPGLTGAWALLRPTGELVRMSPLPLTGGEVDPRALADQLRACPPIRRTALELVHAMPGQGVTSMFTFGDTTGCLRGVLGALGHVPVRPTPQRWQKALGVSLTADEAANVKDDKAARRKLVKAKAAAKAIQLLGDQAGQLTLPRCRTVHEGLVDAVLIAEWLRQQEAEPWHT